MTYEMKMREAHDDGIEEGKEENRVETALEMLNDSMSIDKIVKYTKLSKERIEELASQIKG